MDPIFPQPGCTAPLSLPAAPPMSTAPVSPVPAMWPRDRIDRITALSHDDTAAGPRGAIAQAMLPAGHQALAGRDLRPWI